MTAKFKLNNYQIGAKLNTSPTHKIINTERIDSKYTVITYSDLTNNELMFCEKLFARKAEIIKEWS